MSYTRTYAWRITDTATPTSIVTGDSTATAHYTVTATQTGATDSGWRFTGSVTITNPDPTPLTGVTVTDVVDNGGTCSVVNGSNLTIAAGAGVTLDYTCTWAQPPTSSSGTDTATAGWDAVANNTPTGTATVLTSFSFAAPTTRVDATVAVADTLAGSLGSLTASDSGRPAGGVYTFDHSFDVPGGGCQAHPSMAGLDPYDATASASVDVCHDLAAATSPDTGAGMAGPLAAGSAMILGGTVLALTPRLLRRRR